MDQLVEVGTSIKDYAFKITTDEELKLSDLRGKKVVLSFHPLAFTSVCATQMKDLEANYDKFKELNTEVLGISVDAMPSKKAWGEQLGVEKVLLVEDFWPHGGFAKKLGIFRENDGFSERANIILDEEGKVIFAKVYEIGTLPDVDELLEVIENQ
ncbi:redoxin domain-containing protein [Orenia marismortui]|uniref:Peroxiredoxin n=1 Tax=Orenia marismortui TaxID=46469 RepID=A0A4R8H0P2_9FIRM|nr:redoxin domain-containing protein [Orenia marismortui]TDX51422.1 peroxiredoxin [Orenia marismortui]